MAPGMPLIIKRICAVRILSNLQFFTQVLKFESLACIGHSFVKFVKSFSRINTELAKLLIRNT